MIGQQLGPLQEEWVRRLESGLFAQAVGVLRSFNDCYCCLGVACYVVNDLEYKLQLQHNDYECCYVLDGEWDMLPEGVKDAMKFRKRTGGIKDLTLNNRLTLADANDSGTTFAEIAAFVREHPEAVFSEPA